MSVAATAQDVTDSLGISPKQVTNAQMIGLGAVSILDTYLSPEEYTGTQLRYISRTTRSRDGRHWSRVAIHQGHFSYADNRSGDGTEMEGAYNFTYGWQRAWRLMDDALTLRAAIMADLNLGFIYNTRNSNNPAQARISADITPSASATYRFHVKRLPCQLTYELGLPMLGVMFSPNYGQSYYEIFSEGNYDHNVVPTYVGNAPSLRHALMLDLRLGGTTLRVGYLGEYDQARVNSLKSHVYTNAIMIGWVKSFRLVR